MNDVVLLEYLTDLCRVRRISGISLSTLDAWRAILGVNAQIEGADVPLRAALLLASVLDPDPAEVRARLGPDVADLIDRLAPRDRTLDLAGRVVLWCPAVRGGGAAGEAAIRLLAAEVATVATSNEAVTLRGYLDILAQDGSTSSEMRKVARLLIDELSGKRCPPQPGRAQSPLLVSMSIDIAGSTEAKTRMLALAADDEQRHNLYRQLYRDFLFHEHRFYQALLVASTGGHGPVLDWRRLFVVKGIGDEIWVLYELDAGSQEDCRSAPVRLLSAAVSLVEEGIEWHGTERSSEPKTSLEEGMDQRYDQMELAYKVYIDLITDALEIASIRADYVAANVSEYLGRSAARFDADAAELAGRLNAGQFDVLGRRLRQSFRTDYIGHEVDRFFRTTKAALPGIVTVGQALFEQLGPTTQLIAYPGLFRAVLEYERDSTRPGDRGGWSDLLFAQEEIPASKLKGIGYPYRVYHCITRPQLNGLWRQADNGGLMAPILDIFPLELRNRLKTPRQLYEAEAPERS
jgi:hypothetical protein